MPQQEFRYVAYGVCSQCGRELIRPDECTHALCDCENEPVTVDLQPTILLRSSLLQKLQMLCPVNVSLETFVNSLFTAALNYLDQNPIELKKIVKRLKQ